MKAERVGIQRAKTFDVTPRGDPYYDDYHYGRYGDEIDHDYDRRTIHDAHDRRRSYDDHDDDRSHASSRYSRRSRPADQPRSSSRDRPALTMSNLKTHSEVSATSPSKAYRSPYAETAPRDMQLSRPTFALGLPPPPSESAYQQSQYPAQGALVQGDRRQMVHRTRSETAITKKKSIDMNLAYGDMPPDLASRVDLDPVHKGIDANPDDPQEAEALGLMDRIEDFLDEAHCVQHTATSIIENLQRNPEAAAAVALSLAELSTLLGKMSPGFLAFLKGGSPAVFALLASPQFLIGAGVAVGVTVVMFGGWKIVKRITESASAKTLEAPFEMRALPQPVPAPSAIGEEKALPAPPRPTPASAASYDEALVLRDVEEMSTIDSWRRGISPFGDDQSADVELMSREAERALREQYREGDDDVDPSDSVSQVRSVRSSRSSRSYRSHRSRRQHSHREEEDPEVPERKSSKKDRDGAASEAASERSHRSHRSSRSHHEGSAVSRSSKHTSRVGLKAIEEDGGKEERSEAGSGVGKPKKRDMIKQLFKMKKDKEDRERAVSVLV